MVALRSGAEWDAGRSSGLKLRHTHGELSLGALPGVVVDALRRLGEGGATLHELGDHVARGGDGVDVALLYLWVGRLGARALLEFSLVMDGMRLLTVEPMQGGREFDPTPAPPGRPVRLSRFGVARRDGDRFVIETPLGSDRVVISDGRIAALLPYLVTPRSCEALAQEIRGLPTEVVQAVVGYLAASGLVAECDAELSIPEERSPVLRQWEYHDLLFHSRSRRGAHDYPVGAYFRFRGQLDPLPAIRPVPDGTTIELYRPDMTELERRDMPLTAALERRRSIRTYGDTPVSIEALGEFLFRVARVRGVRPIDASKGSLYEESDRPYPNGGAAYELEIYLTVRSCRGLSAGIYYYDPQHHLLQLVGDDPGTIEALMDHAHTSTGGTAVPQVLITLTSRFQRLSWKYSAIAYATTLKHVGVLFQSMYLVATAMDLAPCALGSGSSELLPLALGFDPHVEASVGEFMLGSRPPDSRTEAS